MKERLQNCIDNLKHLPGVYLMHDKNDKIIYVGKAKDLFKRVSQYFLRPQVGKVLKMRDNVEYFETIITENEKEALVLEMNLIQKYYPRYNILLMDDKHYPYIALKKGEYPYLEIKRNRKDSHFDYFGPFPSSSSAYEMINLINKIFKTRKCHHFQKEVCLYYHLNQCLGPCIHSFKQEDYNETIEEIKSFLKGNNYKARKELEIKMNEASESLDFEMAQEYKKLIDAIDHINAKQNVETRDKKDRDIFAYSSRNGYLALAILIYKKGVLLDKKVFVVEEFLDNETQVSDLILQYYDNHELPSEIIINSDKIIDELSGLIDTNIYKVSKGKLNDLVILAKANANNQLDEYFISSKVDKDNIALLDELGELLGIATPMHIELFDNSHLQGSSPVGAMVAFINGEKCKKLYRKFHIEHEEKRDDLASMFEIVTRHYSRNKNENKKMPDLLLVDGGLNQVKVAMSALKKIDVEIPTFGLYKNDKHQTEGLIDVNGKTYPITNQALFFLLTRMQDEVHRFAISFHRSERLKGQKESILDGVKGLGLRRREMLEKAFPDINALKDASFDELKQVLPEDVAYSLYNKIHFDI